jgi:hypothetical protein
LGNQRDFLIFESWAAKLVHVLWGCVGTIQPVEILPLSLKTTINDGMWRRNKIQDCFNRGTSSTSLASVHGTLAHIAISEDYSGATILCIF